MRTSYSALKTYQQCPLKFKFQEIDRIRVPKGLEAVFGALIHRCLKAMFERTPLYPTSDEIINLFRNFWEQKEKLEIDPEEEKAYYENGLEILKNFYKSNQPWNFNVLDLESRFEVLIPGPASGENHILTGVIDRIDKTQNYYEIIDYKTSRRMPSQDDLDKDLQMSIYHIGLAKRWPHIQPEKIKLSLYFLKHGEKITTSRSQESLEKTKSFIINVIAEIKERTKNNNDFPAFPSPLCGWCGHKPRCPMWKHQYDKSKFQISNFKIEEIINEYLVLKEKNNENNKRLHELQALVYEFMNSEGVERVFGKNGYLTKTLQERFVYDMKKIRKILEDLGRWNEVAKKKNYAVLKAAKTNKKAVT